MFCDTHKVPVFISSPTRTGGLTTMLRHQLQWRDFDKLTFLFQVNDQMLTDQLPNQPTNTTDQNTSWQS